MSERKNEIRVLSDVEHVRARPGMYVGSATLEDREMWALHDDGEIKFEQVSVVTGLLKLFDEIISNSIDEAYRLDFSPPRSRTRRYEIKVNLLARLIPGGVSRVTGVSVEDNGRGIPLTTMGSLSEECDPDIADLPQALVALTALRSGTNFNKKEEEKWVSIGTHGLGATLVNILSREFTADITDGESRFKLNCENGEIKDWTVNKSNLRSGTKISFWPDLEILGGLEFLTPAHVAAIRKRVYDLSVAFPQIDFYFNETKLESRPQDSIDSYMGRIDKNFISASGDKWRLGICSAEDQRQIFLVNGIDAYEGGTILEYARNKVIEKVIEAIKKKHKLDVKPADVRSKICFVLFVDGIPNLKFRSQTKEWVSNPATDFSFAFEDLDAEKIARRLVFDPEIVDPIIETHRLKEKAKENVDLKRKKRALQKMRVVSHVPAIGKDPKKKILFVTEGQSAIGQLSEVRDSSIHGGYPLRGKPLNVNGKTKAVVAKNKEISELMSIVGLDPTGEYDPEDLNYGLVALMADADVDGDSICCLLVNLFVSYWPEFVRDGRLCIVRTPLLKAERGTDRQLFFKEQDYIDAQREGRLDGWAITYLKGLGSLTPDVYREMIENPLTEMVSVEGSEMLETAFGPSADVRKEWLMEKIV